MISTRRRVSTGPRQRGLRSLGISLALGLMLSVSALAQVPTIVTASAEEPASLDPAFGRGSPGRQLLANVYSGLVRYVPGSNEVEGDLASHWTTDETGTRYTFRLRDDVVWHDGYGPLTAHHVAASFERIQDPATGSRYRAAFEAIADITVVDDLTLRIQLAEPNAAFLSVVLADLGGLVVHPDVVAQAGEGGVIAPVGTGPYRVVSYLPDEAIVLEAFADFYRGEPAVTRVEWRFLPDTTVQRLALQRDALNYLIVRDDATVDALRGAPGIELNATVVTGYVGIAMNLERPPLDDVRVRTAIAHALDRATFVEAYVGANGALVDSVIAPGMVGHDPTVELPTYDPQEARRLLEEAGASFEAPLSILVSAGNGYSLAVAQVLQQWLADIGIPATVDALEDATWVERRGSGAFDLHVMNPTRVEADQLLYERFHSSGIAGGRNNSRYTSIDDLIDAQHTTLDPEARAAILSEIQHRIARDLPEIPVYAPTYVTAHADYVRGDAPNTFNWIVFLDHLVIEDVDACGPCR